MDAIAPWEDTIAHYIISRNYSLRTAENCGYILKSHVRWILTQGIRPDEVSTAEIAKYMRSLQDKGRAVNTISHHFGMISRYYEWLTDQKIMSVNPTADIQPPRATMNVRDTFTIDELSSLWKATKTPYEKAIVGLLGINALKPDDVTKALVTDLGQMEGQDVLRLPRRSAQHGLSYTVLAPEVLEALIEVIDGRKSGPLLARGSTPMSRKAMALAIIRVARRIGITSKVSPLTLSFSMRAIAIEKGFSYTGVIRAAGDVETRRLVKWVHRAPTSVEDHAAVRMARLVIGNGSEALDLLMNARVILRESDCPPAASVGHAGAILERHLRELCKDYDVLVSTNNPKLGSYSSSLSQQKIFTPSDVQIVARIQSYRDTAAHGWFDRVSRVDALWVLREIERLIERFPLRPPRMEPSPGMNNASIHDVEASK